jgi:hypothetical protein
MKKRAELLIGLISEDGESVFAKKLTAIPLRDEVIIARSIEFFDDPEPCMIHRSAVMNRIYTEMEDYFEELLQQDTQVEMPWHDVPDKFRKAIHCESRIIRIHIRI